MAKNTMHYFVFHKREKGYFTIVTNLSQGSAGDSFIFLKEFIEGKDRAKDFLIYLADANSADVTTKHSNHKEILRYEETNCSSCTYLIGVKAERKISFSITVNIDGGSMFIQNNKQHLVYLKKGL